METPLISVVMAVYSGVRFLGEAVARIIDQSFCDFEFIIIDDGSTDFTAAILDSYQENDSLLRVYHQENRGLVESLNRSLRLNCGTADGL